MTATEGEAMPQPLLSASDLAAGYGRGSRSAVVLRGVSFDVAAGQTVGIVGESGSGKSTLARVLVGQLPPISGRISLLGDDVERMGGRERARARRSIQLIPQDPYSSLDPRMRIGQVIAEAIDPRRPGAVDREKIASLLEMVSLEPDVAGRLPHEFSGGQRQRIVIARALAVRPRVLIADEVTSALDSSVQAEILNLLIRLQQEQQLAMVFITHNLSVARYMADSLSVLYLGRVVEQGPTDLLDHPAHPYTELLRDSVPDPSGAMFHSPGTALVQEPGDPARPPSGCAFHPRCPYGPLVQSERTVCEQDVPTAVAASSNGQVSSCHFPLINLVQSS